MRRAIIRVLGAGLLALAAVAAGTAQRTLDPGPAAGGTGPPTTALPSPAADVGRRNELAPLIESGKAECIRLNRVQEATIAALVAARYGTAERK